VQSEVDLLIVLHNSKGLLPGLLTSIQKITLPVTIYFLDNNSVDGTPEVVARSIAALPFPAHIMRSRKNNGFARGMNLLAAMSAAEFMFILNPDTELQPGCLELLLERAKSDPGIGICEARQTPREHPKTSDPLTGETSWCSGAAALIRRSAFEQVGGFDEQLFFMYCEDVDLSWKFWLRGWKCVYVRDAVVKHFTQDLMPGKRRVLESYFTFRNSIFLFYRFGDRSQWRVMRGFLLKRFLSSTYSLKSKLLFGIAFIDHIRYIPHLLQTRGIWSGACSWVRFEETSLSH